MLPLGERGEALDMLEVDVSVAHTAGPNAYYGQPPARQAVACPRIKTMAQLLALERDAMRTRNYTPCYAQTLTRRRSASALRGRQEPSP